MQNSTSFYEHIVRRLHRLRLKIKRLDLLRGALVFLTIALGLGALTVTLEAFLWLGPGLRTGLLTAALVLTAGVFVWFVGRPLYALVFRSKWPDDVPLALRVGAHFGHIRDRLADGLQVFQTHQNNPEGYSLELADLSLASIHEETKDLDFERVVRVGDLRRSARAFAAVAGGLALLGVLLAAPLSDAAYRLAHPGRAFPRNSGLQIVVSPGDIEVVKGEQVKVSAQIRGGTAERATLAFRTPGAERYERRLMRAAEDASFAFVFDRVADQIDYFVETASAASETYRIDVVEPPYVRKLQAKLQYPRYSGLGTQWLDENVGDVTALKGTRVHLNLETNKTVQTARLVFDDGTELVLEASGQTATGSFTVMREDSYRIRLEDEKGRSNPTPITYRVSVVEDEFPVVQITYPGQDVDLGEDMMLPITVEAQDDFGFSKVRIGYQVLEEGVTERERKFFNLELPRDARERLLLSHTWNLDDLNIFPEDVVTYFAEAFDNDDVSGPKRARSLTYRVRFPSIYEIYQEVAQGHEETQQGLEDLYEQSRSLKQDLEQIVRKMQRDPELNWEEKQNVREAARKQSEMQEKLESIHRKLEDMVTKLEQNDLLSLETLEKYRELQNLMQEILSPEMKELLRELQKSMEEIDPQKLKEAMQKFADSQEEFLKSLERTLNLLKKLQIEQKLEEAVRKAQELLRRQEELNKQLKNGQQQQRSKYAQEQKGVRQDSKDLGQDLEGLSERMREFPKMPQSRIEAAKNQLGERGLDGQMQRAIEQMLSGDLSGAQRSGSQISQNMQELLEALQTARQELSQQQKQEITRAFNRAAHSLLTLSKEQEKLMQVTQGMDHNSPAVNESANRQQQLLSGLGRQANELYELSQETFFVTPEMGQALGRAMGGMQSAVENFEARNLGKAANSQAQALNGLNRAVAEIRNSMQDLSSAASAIGFQEMMQRLQGISQKQQGVNQQTSELAQQPGGLTMEEQAALSRLAAEQNAVRKALEQLRQEMGNRSDVLGDLGQVSQEMEDVVKELEKRNVDRKVVERQRRILSRLLDAQKSMHRRDFSKKREAQTAKEYTVRSPGELPRNLRDDEDRIREDLLRALREGYTIDYQELIKKYFEALARKQREAPVNN